MKNPGGNTNRRGSGGVQDTMEHKGNYTTTRPYCDTCQDHMDRAEAAGIPDAAPAPCGCQDAPKQWLPDRVPSAISTTPTGGYMIDYTDGTSRHYRTLEELLPFGVPKHDGTKYNAVQLAGALNEITDQIEGLEAGSERWKHRDTIATLNRELDTIQKLYTYRVAYDLLIERTGGYVIRPEQELTFTDDITLAPGVVISTDPLAETVIGGAPKHGKSTLARYIATELPYSGYKVAVIVGEGMRDWHRYTRPYPVGLRPLLLELIADPTVQEHQRQAIDDYGTTVVILDPLISWMAQNNLSENVPGHMQQAVGRLRQLVGPDRLLIVCHHHAATGGRLRGSNALTGQAGVVLTTTRTKPSEPGRFRAKVSEWRSGSPAAAGVGLVNLDDADRITIT